MLGNLPRHSPQVSSRTLHFGRMPPSDVPRPRRYSRSASLGLLLDRSRGAEQVRELKQRRGGAMAGVQHALTHALFVTKAQCTNAGVIIHGKEEVQPSDDWGQNLAVCPRRLAPLRVVSQDHAPCPAIWFCIGDDAVKTRGTGDSGMRRELGPETNGSVGSIS